MTGRVLILLTLTLAALSSCRSTGKAFREGPSHQGETAELSEEAMWAKMAELATPGPAHAALTPLIGKWKADVEMWPGKDAPAQKSQGTSTNRWILGDRFVVYEFDGLVMGQPFSGMGILGYNNALQQYEGTWIDSMGTYIKPLSRGPKQADGTISISQETDPMGTGNPTLMREVWTVRNENSHVFELFSVGADGIEFRSMKVKYNRVRD